MDAQIRSFSTDTGLINDSDFNTGTRNQPLGDPKARISSDLDTLAAYVNSLDEFSLSPYRNQDGSLTTAAQAGRDVFMRQDCASCHIGVNFTNSADENTLTGIGTIKTSSGNRLGANINGSYAGAHAESVASGNYTLGGLISSTLSACNLGTFDASLSGSTISINMNGVDITGDTCSLTGTLSGAR